MVKKIKISVKENKTEMVGTAHQVETPGTVLPGRLLGVCSDQKGRGKDEIRQPSVRTRSCCFTIFKYEDILDKLREYLKQCRYAVIGFEVCPETGRQHIQGFVCWEEKVAHSVFSKQFNNCHTEIQKGTHEQASEYCKKDGKYEEFGCIPTPRKRTDWEQAVKDIESGKEIVDIVKEAPHLLPCQRALREFKNMMLKPKHREVNVVVIYGQAGVGKTRYAYDHHPDLYVKPVGQWWDGYSGQKAILLDDFYGWIEYHDLLRVLDRYPYNAPVKGGFVYAQWDIIYITSNKPPAQWYKHGLTPALSRRINKILYMYNGENGEACCEAQAHGEATDHET